MSRGGSLLYYWRTHLAVTAGAALGTAVLAGALLVGDSMRGSLEQLTLRRLGSIDLALVSGTTFRRQLASDLLAGAKQHGVSIERSVAALVSTAAVVHADSQRRASGSQVLGVDEDLLALFGQSPSAPPWNALVGPADAGETPAVLSSTLAEELGATVGDLVLLHLPRWSATPRTSILGRRDSAAVLRSIRCRVVGVSGEGVARFSLVARQGPVKNVLLPRAALERNLEQPGRANALLVAAPALPAAPALQQMTAALGRAVALDDLGLTVGRGDGWIAVESNQLVLSPALQKAVDSTANELGWPRLEVLSYLANSLRSTAGEIPYSTVAALDPNGAVPGGSLLLLDGRSAPEPGPGEILLGSWAAEDLAATTGDALEMTYFVVDADESLTTASASFVVAGVVQPVELGLDRELTPSIPGVDDADDMQDWDPPFPVDLERVRPRDEEYWDLYHAAPKAFVGLAEGQRLWSSRHGRLTTVRLAPPGDLDEAVSRFEQTLLAELDLDAAGLRFEAVKARGLRGASAASQFSGLFVGFSLFLIVSAGLLVALLFRFGLEQRAGEVGLLLAVGTPPRSVRRRFLGEGVALAICGALLGLPLATLYARLMIGGLTSWWSPAVGTSELALHVRPLSLFGGGVGAVAVTVLSLWIALRELGRLPATALLARRLGETPGAARRRLPQRAALGGAVGCVLAIVAGCLWEEAAAGLFFAAGAAALVAGLGRFADWCAQRGAKLDGLRGLCSMGLAGVARRPGRSTMTVTLMATATFVLVTVALNRRDLAIDPEQPPPGAGGYSLLARSDVPIFQPLNTVDGRFELGFGPPDQAALAGSVIEPLRVLPGDDTSCLSLYHPERPRLLGVPRSLTTSSFPFQAVSGSAEDPWQLLWQDLGPGVVPAIGDAESTQWILKIGLGDELEMTDDAGQRIRLRLMATLHASIFQSELLISEEAFRRHFPSHDGFSAFLVSTPAGKAGAIATTLEARLGRYGLDVQSSAARLVSFQEVANTYLATFQALGGLGLLLGTLGLAVLLLRNVLERRGELAALRALGFSHRRITQLIAIEHLVLLVAGIGLGTLASLLASTPALLFSPTTLPWAGLGATLAAITVAGASATIIAARQALRDPLLAALRR